MTVHRLHHSDGQTLTEFMIMLVMMIGIIMVLMMVMAAQTEYSWRLLKLIGLEFP